jgi:hypothetical protein
MNHFVHYKSFSLFYINFEQMFRYKGKKHRKDLYACYT